MYARVIREVDCDPVVVRGTLKDPIIINPNICHTLHLVPRNSNRHMSPEVYLEAFLVLQTHRLECIGELQLRITNRKVYVGVGLDLIATAGATEQSPVAAVGLDPHLNCATMVEDESFYG